MEMENGKPDWRLLRRSYCQEMFIILFSDHIWPICDPWLDNLTNGGTLGHEVCRCPPGLNGSDCTPQLDTRSDFPCIFHFRTIIWSARATGSAAPQFSSWLESVARSHQGVSTPFFWHPNIFLNSSQEISLDLRTE